MLAGAVPLEAPHNTAYYVQMDRLQSPRMCNVGLNSCNENNEIPGYQLKHRLPAEQMCRRKFSRWDVKLSWQTLR